MHELLFRHQKALADDDLRRYATDLGLDVARFNRDRAATGAHGRVHQDMESGMESGEVRGTPTLFIDGAVHRGAYDDAATLLEALAR
jgi:predicted DsbA family dithiol-disulfide isomerase